MIVIIIMELLPRLASGPLVRAAGMVPVVVITGAHLENLVLGDLLAWRDARLDRADVFYWRTAIGEEVDFVMEAAGKLVPIEVKAATRPRVKDAGNLTIF